MKIIKTSILSLVLAGALNAGEEVKVVVITPPEPAKEAWYVEAAAFGSVAAGDLYESVDSRNVLPENLQMMGADVTVGYKIDDSNAVQLRMGYSYGTADNRLDRGEIYETEAKLHSISVMPGYRYTCALDDSFSIYAAVHAGLTNASLKFNVKDYMPGQYYAESNTHDSEWGLGYSAEVGLRYDISDTLYTFVAYEFRGCTAEPTVGVNIDLREQSAESQSYHIIRLGMGMEF